MASEAPARPSPWVELLQRPRGKRHRDSKINEDAAWLEKLWASDGAEVARRWGQATARMPGWKLVALARRMQACGLPVVLAPRLVAQLSRRRDRGEPASTWAALPNLLRMASEAAAEQGVTLDPMATQVRIPSGAVDIHGKTIDQRISWLRALAREHSEEFSSPGAYLARQHYQARHPTAIAVLKCMDGRINIPVATRTPLGIIQPFRNLGGMFDLGWPHLGEVLTSYVQRNVGAGRQVLALITYHFSRGDRHRGCAGFDYDTEAAIEHTAGIKRQVEHVFGRGVVYPVVCGFETDEDALILHGAGGQRLDMARLSPDERAGLEPRLVDLFPDMPGQIRGDLLPLLLGNAERIAEIRGAGRPIAVEHREWMICLGRGFDFLHTPNVALIIGPYSPDLAAPILKAASIIEANMAHGRSPDDGFLLLASTPYDEIGVDRARAELKSRFLSSFAAATIRRERPALAVRMRCHTAVLDWRSRALEFIDGAQG